MAVIDELPESVLDVLAVELRTPYYVDSLSIEAKREIIKKSFLWASRAGTVSAVEELIQTVFGEGEVVEWPDFSEEPREPGTFDIVTSGQLTPDAATFFARVVKRVKNVRSHIRRILIERHEKMQMYTAAGSVSEPTCPVLNHHQMDASGSLTESAASAIVSAPSTAITNHPQGRTAAVQNAGLSLAGGFSSPKTYIWNHADPRQRSASATPAIASAVFVESRTIRILNNLNNSELKVVAAQSVPAAMAAHSHTTIL